MDAFEAISMPDSSTSAGKKCFTLPEANRALILVRRIVDDIVQNYRRLRHLHETCKKLDSQGKTAQAEEIREEFVAITDHLAELRDELEEIGCELKDYGLGLVDFPARYDDRDVLLCWKLGEEAVSHWHAPDTGFAGRSPIPDDWQ